MSLERLKRHQRHITKRIIVRGTLILDTATCLGNGDTDSPTDLALLRDSISDHALLAGSSITGALRNYLREYEQGYGVGEQRRDMATSLFGSPRSDDKGEQSPLIVHDAISSKLPTIELRDGGKIDSIKRIAEEGAKYDLELLAAGTTFPLYFELLIDGQDNKETQLKEALTLALEGLKLGEISIGMKKRRGFGRSHVDKWQVWEFDLNNHSDRLAWLTFDRPWSEPYAKQPNTSESIAEALGVTPKQPDKRDRFSIQATFKLASSLLIRSGQDSTGCAPDVVHLRSHRDGQLEPVLSGTSLAGVLRHRAERIVNTLGKHQAIVKDLFGFVEEDSKQAKASRLAVHESVIENTADLVQNRIAIDRFTGGASHGALFSEQPIFGSDETRLTLELELRQPRKAEIGLLLLLLKDLWTSDLPVGGESSIGRGRLQGLKATMIRQIPGEAIQNWTISQDGERLQVSEADVDALEAFVSNFSGEVAA